MAHLAPPLGSPFMRVYHCPGTIASTFPKVTKQCRRQWAVWTGRFQGGAYGLAWLPLPCRVTALKLLARRTDSRSSSIGFLSVVSSVHIPYWGGYMGRDKDVVNMSLHIFSWDFHAHVYELNITSSPLFRLLFFCASPSVDVCSCNFNLLLLVIWLISAYAK